ncbi:choice-of-anchor J domain-containing protein [Flavobacterium humi]|uniref:VWA domain-containing protein n=1 Tax=Flavobacterium humi TaxID=2562683 RepID=A0A4Z0L333_9FLAO|nr:choice-of-anchor J domain-containing protein [Flavobacterium humi]TGD56850.1 hypothetical protein E4635_13705 [Flavobacterium humi]
MIPFIKRIVFTVITFFAVAGTFAQTDISKNYSDKEIGFDLAKQTEKLKRRDAKAEYTGQEISKMRDMYSRMYLDKKANEENVLKEMQPAAVQKSGTASRTTLDNIPQSERDALVALYTATNGGSWTNTVQNKGVWPVGNSSAQVVSWDSVTQTGWFGVTVTDGHVTSLRLPYNAMNGPLPAQISQLTYLNTLDLSRNFTLSGSLIQQVYSLTKLEYLNLASTHLTGTISGGIGQLIKLKFLDLSLTSLSGSLPVEIGQLTNLEYFYSHNGQLGGVLPSQIGQLIRLKVLDLHSNLFTGSIPTQIRLLGNLKTLNLCDNFLSGIFAPLGVGQLVNLEYLNLYDNQLTNLIGFGDISSFISLKFLYLSQNQISGPIPIFGTQMHYNLLVLDLSRNNLSGSIPTQVSNFAYLEHLSLSFNQLSDSIPAQIGNMTKLKYIVLGYNQLTGSIPSTFGNLSNLEQLIVFNNKLSGTIPNLTGLIKLKEFRINDNLFRFVDFHNQYTAYMANIPTPLNSFYGFYYSPQGKTDSEVTITQSVGSSVTLTMCTDNRYTTNDTFQWFKGTYPGGVAVNSGFSTANRQLVLSNLTAANAGDYYCLSKHPQITNSSNSNHNLVLQREAIHLNVGIVSTLTECTEGFEGQTFPPAGWLVRDNGVGTANNWIETTTASLVHLGSKAAYVNNEGIGVGNTSEDWLITPRFTVPTNGELQFFAKQTLLGNSNTIYQVRVSTDPLQNNMPGFNPAPLASWTEVTLNSPFNVFAEKKVDLSSYAGQSVYVAFVKVFTQTSSNIGDRWIVDDVRVVRECKAPTHLDTPNIGSTSVNLSWAENGTATQWEVEVVPASGNPTGVGVLTSSNPYTVTNLLPNTAYVFYVRAVCPSCNQLTSNWSESFHFSTTPTNACPGPNHLTTSGYSGTSITLSWNEIGMATSWELVVEPITSGYGNPTPTTGTVITVNQNPTYTVSGLNPNVAYRFYVRSVCGAGSKSEWVSEAFNLNTVSCMANNPNSTYVTGLLIALVNDLITTVNNGGTVTSAYNSPQLQALAPYITDTNIGIYNFSYAPNMENGFSFSFSNHGGTPDFIMDSNVLGGALITDMGIFEYLPQNNYVATGVAYSGNAGLVTKIRRVCHINFCPPIASCTVINPNSIEVNRLMVKLIQKLITLRSGGMTDAAMNGITLPELTYLAPYISDGIPGIYNFASTTIQPGNQLSSIQFSFLPNEITYDVYFAGWQSAFVTDTNYQLNLTGYTDSSAYMQINDNIFNNTIVKTIKIKHVEFCPDEMFCKKHIAIVVDESASIDESEARKIKKQLKNFVTEQANANFLVGSNTYVSLIGLSDKDNDIRTDNVIGSSKILPSGLTNYTNWINKYRLRDNTTAIPNPGAGPNSDYWNSGLSKALAIKADIVILITDGCQTANAAALKTTMGKFKNNNNTPNGPQLYVIGIENGFYVDESTVANKMSIATERDSENNPNLNPSLSRTEPEARAAGFLKKSLKYLLNYPGASYPEASKYGILGADYYGHEDFRFLGNEKDYLYNELVRTGLTCGDKMPTENCDDCYGYQPIPGKTYILSAWVKQERRDQTLTYETLNPQGAFIGIKLEFRQSNADGTPDVTSSYATDLSNNIECAPDPSSEIIEGWQRIFKKFTIPQDSEFFNINIINQDEGMALYFDDIRIHPIDGSMKSFVYDPETYKLMSELDENNYATFYEYDKEGGLIRVKKETAKGVKTIQETRSGNVLKE